jgi:hypothetical protein
MLTGNSLGRFEVARRTAVLGHTRTAWSVAASLALKQRGLMATLRSTHECNWRAAIEEFF